MHFGINWNIKISEMLSFLSLRNNSVTIGLHFLLPFISAIISSNIINPFFSLLDYSLLYFHKHHYLFLNNQETLLEFLVP